jgi:hypothetical protein
MDAITLIKKGPPNDGACSSRTSGSVLAYRTAGQIRDRIVPELTMDAEIEEQVLYPATREVRGESQELVKEAEAEHIEAKAAIAEVTGLDPQNVKFPAAMGKLMAGVRHHLREGACLQASSKGDPAVHNEVVPPVQPPRLRRTSKP